MRWQAKYFVLSIQLVITLYSYRVQQYVGYVTRPVAFYLEVRIFFKKINKTCVCVIIKYSLLIRITLKLDIIIH